MIYHQDCLTGMQHFLKPGQIDVVVTSPPYNLGVKYGQYDDTQPRSDYLDWTEQWAVQVKQVLSDKGSFFLNIGSKPSDPWGPFEVLTVLRKYFTLQNVIHWIKSIYIAERSYNRRIEVNVGHYKPINSERYLNDLHEYIFHFSKDGDVRLDRLAIGVPYKDKSNVTRWQKASKAVRCRGNAWYIPYQTIKYRKKDRPHPATFPPQLAEMCIRLHGLKRVTTVLDPFLGLGNTALACLDLGVDFIGFEIDQSYLQQALLVLKARIA
ncbi:site-specific DNA-methyltransferase [bacterium]|nr:site-specific DNA-methyltransferase [bacterium]